MLSRKQSTITGQEASSVLGWMFVSGVVNRHLGKPEQPQNLLPAPSLAGSGTILRSHLEHIFRVTERRSS